MGQLNPTRQEILDAYDALDDLLIYAKSYEQESGFNRVKLQALAQELRQDIENALPPIPEPTMNDIKWDDNEHFLAEAEHPDWGKVAMLRESGLIIFVQPIEKKIGDIQVARVEELTPTGKRYTLTEVQE